MSTSPGPSRSRPPSTLTPLANPRYDYITHDEHPPIPPSPPQSHHLPYTFPPEPNASIAPARNSPPSLEKVPNAERSHFDVSHSGTTAHIQSQSRSTGKNPERLATVHYPDEQGGRLHNILSPGSQDGPDEAFTDIGHSSRAPSFYDIEYGDDEEEMYDWSDEDDLVDEEAKFKTKIGSTKKERKGWGFKRCLYFSFGSLCSSLLFTEGSGIRRIVIFFFSTLIGSTLLAGALVAVPILLHIYYLKPHRTSHREFITGNVSAWLYWAAANVLISWYLALLIDIVPIVTAYAVDVVWGDVSEAFKSKVEMYEAGKGWVKPLFYAGTAWLSWFILFEKIFKLYNHAHEANSRARYTPRTYQVIQFLFFFTLLFCAEKMLVQVMGAFIIRIHPPISRPS